MTTYPKLRRACLLAMAAAIPLIAGACERAETASSELDGHWWSKDYGLLLEIAGGDVQSIEQTPVSCLPTNSSSLERLRARLAPPPDLENGVIAVGHKATLSTKNFSLLSDGGFEQLCPGGLTGNVADPVLNFEVLWQTFDQHYAFFAERHVDWDAVYAETRPKVTEDMSSEDLARTMGDMLNRLKDAHVSLYADGDGRVWVQTRLEARLREECRQKRGGGCDLYDYYDDQLETFQEILETVYFKGGFKTGLDGQARWGKIDDRTGYFKLDAMAGLSSGGYSASADLEAIETILDDMLDDIGGLPTMILDVRVNGGGHDTVSVAIANRFADQRRVFGTKRAFTGGDDALPTDMVIEPKGDRRFDGEVAVLISGETASAAEIFAMAMRALPQVTLIGATTQGILSDELYRTLPNGWSFSLSNEIYLAHDDALFEAVGVPPEVEAPFLMPSDLERRIDRGIDTAISVMAARNEPGPKSQ